MYKLRKNRIYVSNITRKSLNRKLEKRKLCRGFLLIVRSEHCELLFGAILFVVVLKCTVVPMLMSDVAFIRMVLYILCWVEVSIDSFLYIIHLLYITVLIYSSWCIIVYKCDLFHAILLLRALLEWIKDFDICFYCIIFKPFFTFHIKYLLFL